MDFGFWKFENSGGCADFLCRALHVMDSEPACSLHRASCTVLVLFCFGFCRLRPLEFWWRTCCSRGRLAGLDWQDQIPLLYILADVEGSLQYVLADVQGFWKNHKMSSQFSSFSSEFIYVL